MSGALYTLDILRLAAAVAEYPRLAAPELTIERSAVPCGSRIAIDLVIGDDGRIAQIGMAVHACALGQAAAALLARSAIGSTPGKIGATQSALAAYLRGTVSNPGDWPGFETLAAARDYPARHPAILLPFEAASAAMRVAA